MVWRYGSSDLAGGNTHCGGMVQGGIENWVVAWLVIWLKKY